MGSHYVWRRRRYRGTSSNLAFYTQRCPVKLRSRSVLGLDTGGSDGLGHLGMAATATPFGPDVFSLPSD
jgi:hypothetical protein